MELWIRSQDKKILLKVETIKVINNWFYLNDKYDIGFYKTNERALEVLDEIQNKLITLCDSMNRHLYIYEMPEE